MQYRRRTMLAAFAGSVWIGSLLLARPGVVTTQSGARYEGEVIERGDDIMVNIRGVQTTINRGDVASLEYSVSFEEEFQTRLKKLDEKDVAGRIELAKWAMQKQQYVSARDALELALVIDPNSSEAVDLQTLVRSQMRLAQQAKLNAARDQAKPTEQSEPTTDKAGTPPAGRPMLGQEDVQAIRRIEWRADDPAVRLRIDKKAARQYADMKSMRWEEFSRQRPIEQARMRGRR